MSTIFRDEYTDFTFNGVRSSQMKVWITNSRDIVMRLTPEFTDSFVTPTFSNIQLLNNTNKTKSSYSLKCIAIDITMHDWRAIQQWLSPDAIGRLEFDFNDRTYYNAKVSKAITGTTFVRGSYDKLIGDLYIVEFTVEFTTVGDFAALGMINVGILNKNFGDKIDYLGTCDDTADDYIYTIDSVSNNKYFMPSIIKINGGNIPANQLVKISNREIVFNDSGAGDSYAQDPDAKIYVPSIGVGNKLAIVFEIFGKKGRVKIVKYNYSVDGAGLLKPGNNISRITETEVDTSFTIYGDNLLFFTAVNELFSFKETPNYYALCNTGAYDLYPHLFFNPDSDGTNVTYSVSVEKDKLYSYTMLPIALEIDGRNGVALCNGTIAENASYNIVGTEIKRNMVISASENNGIFRVPSGRAELIKIKILDIQQCYSYTKNEPVGDSDIAALAVKIAVFGDLRYQRYDNCILHCFSDVSGSHLYNTSLYPYAAVQDLVRNSYYSEIIDSKLLLNSVIVPQEDGTYLLFISKTEGQSYFKKNGIYYLSLCDYTAVEIQGEGFIHLQTRDAF